MRELFTFFITIWILTGCSKKEIRTYQFNELISTEKVYSISDSSYNVSGILDFEVYKDSLAFLCDFYSKSIFKYNLNTGELEKLGSIGDGPGEYRDPDKLFIKNKKVYYIDSNSTGVESFDFNGKNPEEEKNRLIKSAIARDFIIDNKNEFIWFYAADKNGNLVSNSKGESFGKAPEIFNNSKFAFGSFAGAYIKNDLLYFTHMHLGGIFKINLKTKKEERLELNIKGFKNWDNVKGKDLTREFSKNVRQNNSRIGAFLGFGHNSETYFYISIYNSNSESNYFVCNDKGEIQFRISGLDSYSIEKRSGDRFYSIKTEDKRLLIKSFTWNEKFKNLIDG